MSQMVTRKSAVGDEKEKVLSDSPMKDMKKKMAANAEKEKQVTEKQSEKVPEKSKPTEKAPEKPKPTEKAPEKPKPIEKAPEKPKQAEKAPEKPKQTEKAPEKPKQTEKAPEKPKQTEKAPEKPKPTEKAPEKPKQAEKAPEKPKPTEKPAEKPKPADKPAEKNGVEKKVDNKDKKDAQEKKDDKAEKNGKSQEKQNGEAKPNGRQNGHSGCETVSDDEQLEADDEFPELAYDDSDSDEPHRGPSRSRTRRDQVKATRTPETPLPATEKPADSDESKILKLKEDAPSDRKLRSSDSPRRDRKDDNGDADKEIEIIDLDADEEPRKTDTNYSKSRVKVSPYRRSTRLADQTTSSVMANYTGNNTTMEMDITESFVEDPSLDDSSYLNGLRAIKGRRSYKLLKEMSLKHINANRSVRSTASAIDTSNRPTGTVVGRKRKPESEESVELGTEAEELTRHTPHTKRMRLLDRISLPFRRTHVSTPLPARRNPEIVGINTDLPLTAPVAAPETFDPETLKTAPAVPAAPPTVPLEAERDSKRCVVM